MISLTDPIYSNADKARAHLESLHWPNGPVCPRCGDTDRVRRATGKSTRPGVVVCNPCRRPFTVTVGTVLEDSKIPLNKWLLAFRLMAGSKKGMSAYQLHRSLGITYKSAWFLGHRIRGAINMEPEGPLGGPDAVVEADEPMSAARPKTASRSPAPKTAVVALAERDGQARSFHVANLPAATLRPLIVVNVDRKSHLMTDERAVYTPPRSRV